MLVRKHLKNVKNYTPGKPIDETRRELGLKQVIKLASNENPFPPSGKVLETIRKNAVNINRYPDAQCFYLRAALARKYRLKPGNFIFGNGSDELIVLALRAFVENSEEVIVGFPTFLIYEIQAKAMNLKVVRCPFKDFRYDLDAIRRKITKKTKLIFIANPDNPNGTYLSHKEVAAFLRSMPKNIIVFFDEAYFEFAPSDFPKTLDFFKKGYNVIFSRTFSKAYGLAGLRVGYAIASEVLISAMDKTREPFNVNSLAQKAAEVALADSRHLGKVVNSIKSEKEYLYQQFDKYKIVYIPSATNFILVDLKGSCSFSVVRKLLERGVIVREMSAWGFKNFIRVSVGLHSENVRFIRVLKKILGK